MSANATAVSATPKAARAAGSSILSAGLDTIGVVRKATLDRFERLGIRTVRDLITHYPTRYDDLRAVVRIADLGAAPGGDVNVVGVIRQFSHVRLRGRVRSKSTALVDDGSGMLRAVWFGRPYLGTQLKPGMRIFMRGRVEQTLTGPAMSVVQHRTLDDAEAFEGGLEPVYPLTAGLTNRTVRSSVARAVRAVLDDPDAIVALDPLPPKVAAAHSFPPARAALISMHEPSDEEEALAARRRAIFSEFFVMALLAAMRRASNRAESAADIASAKDAPGVAGFRDELARLLPFALTGAQSRTIDEVAADMLRTAPMNRLLQGDVGSGKTAVAAAAMLLAARAGFQTAFMAPTEILATQQFQKLDSLLGPAGISCARLVGGMKRRSRDEIVRSLADGRIDVAIGTHALITEDVAFAALGLVVIDEQHRFGVMQRAALRAKGGGRTPHTLVMTATPIPRTLAQSIYADLDVSTIDELPPGRTPVKTHVRTEDAKPQIFAFVRDEIGKGRQAFVVCPAIEEGERGVHSAEEEARRLRGEAFAGLRVALLHGRMTGQEKDEVMRLFASGFVQVLISTTVVEVGVDVPNASVMVVLDAQVFGLAQLHQLRGRVGRGAARSHCILVAPAGSDDIRRLTVLERTNDGFVIAEEDLKIRGAGDLGGVRQHGGDDLKLAHLIRDFAVFLEAKQAALDSIASDPRLRRPEHAGVAAYLAALDATSALRATS